MGWLCSFPAPAIHVSAFSWLGARLKAPRRPPSHMGLEGPWCWQLGCLSSHLHNISLQVMSHLTVLLSTASRQQESLDFRQESKSRSCQLCWGPALFPPCSIGQSKSQGQSKFQGKGNKLQLVACVCRSGRNHCSHLWKLDRILWLPLYSCENGYFIIYFN